MREETIHHFSTFYDHTETLDVQYTTQRKGCVRLFNSVGNFTITNVQDAQMIIKFLQMFLRDRNLRDGV